MRCTQDESGTAMATFPQSMHGYRDFKINDEDLTVTVGNRGSFGAVVPI